MASETQEESKAVLVFNTSFRIPSFLKSFRAILPDHVPNVRIIYEADDTDYKVTIYGEGLRGMDFFSILEHGECSFVLLAHRMHRFLRLDPSLLDKELQKEFEDPQYAPQVTHGVGNSGRVAVVGPGIVVILNDNFVDTEE